MESSVHLRYATIADAEQIYAVHDSNNASDEWAGAEQCRAQLERLINLGFVPIVAEVDGRIVGEIKMCWGADVPALGRSLDISTLFVHRDYHHRGIGRLLTDCALGISRENKCDCLCVWADPEAVGFYKKVGFELAFVLNNYLLKVDANAREVAPVLLSQLDEPSGHLLQTQRLLHPRQRWQDLLEQERLAPEWRGEGSQRQVIHAFDLGESLLAVYRLAYWLGDKRKAELYLWTEGPVRPALLQSVEVAGQLGVERLAVYVFGQVENEVVELGGVLQDEPAAVFVRR